MKQWDDESLDRFLDDGLSQFAQEAPREGLEQRIMANLAAERSRTWQRWIWAAAPVFAVLLVAVILWRRPSEKIATLQTATYIPAPSRSKRPASAPVRVIVVKKHAMPRSQTRVVETATASPRLPTFPSRTEESQGQLLLRFVQNNPALAEQVVAEEEEFQKLAYRNSAPSETPNGERSE